MKQKILNLTLLLFCMIVGMGSAWGETKTGTIKFGTYEVKISNAKVNGDDDLGNAWTIKTEGTSSYTSNSLYYQVGSSKAPATSITFTVTLPKEVTIESMSAKFGGFSGTAGTVTLKVGDTTIGTGNLNATNDVTVNSTSTEKGNVLTVSVTEIAKGVKCFYISYTYKEEGGTTPTLVDATWEISPITVEADETTTASITTNYDGTLSVSSNNEGIATATITGKTLSISGISAGTTTLTITGDATSTYNAINKTIDVTVTAAQGGEEQNKYITVTYNFNKLEDYPADFPIASGNKANAQSFSISGNDIIINAKDGYYIISSTNDENRALFLGKTYNVDSKPQEGTSYVGFPAKEGCKLVKVDVTTSPNQAKDVILNIFTTKLQAVSDDYKTPGSTKETITFELKDPEINTEYWLTASGASGKNFQFNKIVLYYEGENTPATPTNSITFKATNDGSNYWATFSSTENVVLPLETIIDEENSDFAELLDVFVISIALDGEFELTSIEGKHKFLNGWYLNAGYGYLLKSESTVTKQHSYEYTVNSDGTFGGIPTEDLIDNMLKPSTTPMTGDNYFYKLSTLNGEHVGFYWGEENGGAFEMKNPNGAYLAIPKSAGVKSLSLEDLTTAIERVQSNTLDVNAPVYNIVGQRVNASAKGILIQNGKKYINK